MLKECICGATEGKIFKHRSYFVTKHKKGAQSDNKRGADIELMKCDGCGLIRQINNNFDYIDFYKNEYLPTLCKETAKDYDHDYTLAKKRFANYKFNSDSVGIDIGCGSGAFVDLCRESNITSFGCEIGRHVNLKQDVNIYWNDFEDVNFPNFYFDWATIHDVLEHVMSPFSFLSEAYRTIKDKGKLIIDFPNFFVDKGKHHWRKEHLWYFNEQQLKLLLEKIGFEIESIKYPIPSKIVYYCTKRDTYARPLILVPPGIGDIYWVFTKIEQFLDKNKINKPVDIGVFSTRSKNMDLNSRSFDFIKMFPFANLSGTIAPRNANKTKEIWHEAYSEIGRTVFKNVEGADYFLSYNGNISNGVSLEKVDPEYEPDWFLENRFISLEEDRSKKKCLDEYGKYIVFYFISHNTYRHWFAEFPEEMVIRYIKSLLSNLPGYKGILCGANWDKSDKIVDRIISNTGIVDLRGKTSVEQLFGVLRGAELTVGFPSGLTIMSTVLKTKTLIIWNKYYKKSFWIPCCPPPTFGKNYFIEDTKGLDSEKLVRKCLNIIDGNLKLTLDLKEEVKFGPSYKQLTVSDTGKQPVANNKKEENGMLNVLCVLRSGGVYSKKDVTILRNMLNRNFTCEYNFVVYSDIDIENKVPLKHNWPGWWSKAELFYHKGPALYFDLDTVIIKNLDKLHDMVMSLKKGEFKMLIPFNERRRKEGRWASGVMAWNGDFSYIPKNLSQKIIIELRMDQTYIENMLREKGVDIKPINEFANIFSYKWHCQKGVPDKADVICFHGKTKPNNTRNEWLERYYR